MRYTSRQKTLFPIYLCQRDGIQNGMRICQSIPGHELEKAIGDLLVETVSPVALELAVSIEQELAHRVEAASCCFT